MIEYQHLFLHIHIKKGERGGREEEREGEGEIHLSTRLNFCV